MPGIAMTRRAAVGGLISSAVIGGPACALAPDNPPLSALSSDVAEMLMFGFDGAAANTRSAQILAEHVGAGRVGGVFFVKANVGSRDDVIAIIREFSSNKTSTPLIAIDHEGGFVQRLTERHGFARLPSARRVAATKTPDQAKELYSMAASELAAIGFNLNLAPVIDLDDPASPAVGHFERAFAGDPATVTAYAEAFVDGFASARILCALKHFPGQGLSRDDSHRDLPDITATWSESEIEPYSKLIASGRARIIMTGHMRLASVEKEPIPITLSSAVTTGMLRDRLGFNGVVITDDLDMSAVSGRMERREAIIRAIAAGNDILMIRNTSQFDPALPQNVARWVRGAIDKGDLSETRIRESADRVRKLKQTFADGRRGEASQ
jgi:beta-N-acetylhexosaminidase